MPQYEDTASFIKSNRPYFEDFITRSTYHSNAIEGNTLSYAETYAVIFNENSFKVAAKPREIYEAINHKYALSYVLDNLKEPLSKKMITDIGRIINKNIDEIDGYRKIAVFVRGAEYIPPAPSLVEQLMMYFVYNYNNTKYDNIFFKAAFNHIEFERIHPFGDGNGRTGRLLINYELLRNNLPPVVINVDDRTEYFKYLASQDAEGLSRFLEALCDKEKERMELFAQD